MDETNNSSFIETAMKHHSTTQAAIKSLQHQLECFDHIRKSTKEIFLLTEKNEKAVENSANSLLHSTSQYLFDTPENKVQGSPLLTSTISKKNPDDAVIRNLLPTFEDVQPLTALDIQSPQTLFSPIKPINQSILTSATKDSFASTTLPPTPSLDVVIDSAAPLHEINKNSISPGSKNFSVVAPSSGCMSLSEVLARLAYSSALNGTASGQESFGSSSDELISLLEKISRTGEQLKIELQEARLRETALLKEIQRLRSQQNGFHAKSNSSSPAERSSPHVEVLKAKCKKLEDALLSLQDENIKLNRQVKSRLVGDSQYADSRLDEALKRSEEENYFLKKQFEKIQDQLRLMEDKNQEPNSPTGRYDYEKDKHALMEEQTRCREAEAEIKNLTQRLNDLNSLLVEKDEKIFKMEEKICEAKDESRISLSRCEDLEKKDVYKRKEVMQLCDKFEKMKKISKKMENDLLEYRKKEREDLTRKWAFENSLQKVAQENNSLRSKMNTELQKMTMDKLLLEKDYDLLKKRYNTLLDKVGKNDARISEREEYVPQRSTNHNSKPRSASSIGIITPVRSQRVALPRSHSAAGDNGPLTSTRRHHRRHTTSRLTSHDQSRDSSDAKVSPSDETDSSYKLLPRTVPEKRLSTRISRERRSLSATPTRDSAVPRVTSLDRARDLCNRLSNSLSPLDVRHLAKSAYTEEYIKNMDGINKLLSVSDRSANKTTETVDNSPQPPTSQLSSGRNHRRTRTEPGLLCHRLNGERPKSLPRLAYGESPYSEEYMRNMDGVRLVVNLSSNSGEAPPRVGNSPGKGILKKNGSFSSVGVSDARRDDSKNSSPVKSVTTAPSTYSPSSPERLKNSSISNQKRSSCASERSLHLSDLPCEQGDVYEKFRNFDSHISTLPLAQTVEPASKPSPAPDRPPAARRFQVVQPSGRARERSEIFKNLPAARKDQKPIRKEDDAESTEHSSISTVRDHAGRVEFLRELQTNTGVRMPALMRDVTINNDVIVDEVDLDEEVHMGLSNNQQAYADKLVRKYTKKAKRT